MERASPVRFTDASIPIFIDRVEAREAFVCALSYLGTYAATVRRSWMICFWSRRVAAAICNFCWPGRFIPYDWSWPENVRRFEHVAPDDHPALYSSSRATLNITRQEMAASGYCPSGRFFEAAACGTPILTDDWEGLRRVLRSEARAASRADAGRCSGSASTCP